MTSSLAKELKRLNKPAPDSLDPESADFGYDFESHSNKKKRSEAFKEDEDDFEMDKALTGPKLRTLAEFEEDPKYKGKKATRREMFEQQSSDEEDDDEEEEEDDDDDDEGSSKVEALLRQRQEDLMEESSSGDDDEEEGGEEESEEEMDDDEDDDDMILRRQSKRPKLESSHAKNQVALWSEMMGVRIRMQNPMVKSLSLPAPEVIQESKKGSSKVSTVMEECGSRLISVINKLEKLRTLSLKEHGTSIDDNMELDSKMDSKRLWKSISKLNDASASYYENTFDKWHRKTQTTVAGRQLKAVNRSISEQVDEIMKKDGVVKRSQFRPKMDDDHQVEGEGTDMVYDPEVFNDAAFYQQLLLHFVNQTSATEANGLSAVDDELVQDKLRKKLQKSSKKRKDVDRKATKGRKIRYEIHPKLVNFVAPKPMGETLVDTDQLFASLFAT